MILVSQKSLLRISLRALTSSQTPAESIPKSKWKYQMDESIQRDIINDITKPRHHPGKSKLKTIKIPQHLEKAIKNTLEDQDHPKAQLLQSSLKLVRHLEEKKPPMENQELRVKIQKIQKRVISRLKHRNSDLLHDKNVVKSQLTNEMKKNVYNWVPEKYDTHKALLYLVGKSTAEYSVVSKIFSEIKARDPNWTPRSLFDFGSGVGTVTWAINSCWPKSVLEYFNVDSSAEMNELAEHILKGGRGEMQLSVKGVYYRQFLPARLRPYDLVVSAYSLMEQPSQKKRLDVIANLWNRTTKYLVVVEQGSNAGYKVINEVRDFVLNMNNGHIFGPCPHDDVCPRYVLDDGTPCNFEVAYHTLPLSGPSQLKRERYSYIIMAKGERKEEDPKWPRLVRPTLVRHKHCICNLCTREGAIEQAVFTASKYGKPLYRCAKASEWGDLLPINIKEGYEESEKSEEDGTEIKQCIDAT